MVEGVRSEAADRVVFEVQLLDPIGCQLVHVGIVARQLVPTQVQRSAMNVR